jgi:hypothetical protein
VYASFVVPFLGVSLLSGVFDFSDRTASLCLHRARQQLSPYYFIMSISAHITHDTSRRMSYSANTAPQQHIYEEEQYETYVEQSRSSMHQTQSK